MTAARIQTQITGLSERYASPGPTETLKALPVLAAGVTIASLQRVWHATPADRRQQAASLLESAVLVLRVNGMALVKLRDLSLDEVEARIGAVTPKFFVRFYAPGKKGVQVATFVNESDANKFAGTHMLHAEPAKVESLEVAR